MKLRFYLLSYLRNLIFFFKLHYVCLKFRHRCFIFFSLADLSVKRSGACVQPEDDPCMSIPEEDLRLPVCGSDNLSYVSPEALWCAKSKFPDKSELISLCLVTLDIIFGLPCFFFLFFFLTQNAEETRNYHLR